MKIRVSAFGLNRSEWFTRRGDSPTISFPRVLGIECVGEVHDSGGMELEPGARVTAIMGGMGRQFDGSYAEETLVPRTSVFRRSGGLPWEKVGALPEMLQTTHGSLHTGLEINRASSLLIRGGTSSVGFTALAMAKAAGLRVGVTTRSESKRPLLLKAGADEVWVDDGEVAKRIAASRSEYDRALELIGATTLLDTSRCVLRGGIVCMTGILGGKWARGAGLSAAACSAAYLEGVARCVLKTCNDPVGLFLQDHLVSDFDHRIQRIAGPSQLAVLPRVDHETNAIA